MKLSPIDGEKEKYQSLRQRLQEAIKHAIITCELAPGAPIREGDLAERYGVSKTPVREALTSLLQNKFVDYTPNRGFTVSSISISDVQEIYEARTFYETGLFRLALRCLSDADIRQLMELNEVSFNQEDPESIAVYLQANTDFHMCIAKASRNSRLVHHYQAILDEAQRLMYMDLIHNNVLLTWHGNHERIINAIRNQDEVAGVNAIREIITNQKLRNFGPG
ncbi:MAG: GntR family transcriptional regulator [Chloroflexi bacterium]|nr:GntR family transcriptional regulator [Chloroflexota bacterium]